MTLLLGPVVFIDDDIEKETTPAWELATEIIATGRPLARYTDLPPEEHSQHWRSIAFVVLDWDLSPGSKGALGAATLSEFKREALFKWLRDFTSSIFCPVFIVSGEDVPDIESQLAKDETFARLTSTGRIKVFSKQTVVSKFIEHVEGWVAKSPALTALNIWANEIELATDRLFQDMEALEPDWPAYVWKQADIDHVDPSFEIASVISANLLHRMDVLQFDVPVINNPGGSQSRADMRRVVHGRTFVPGERLYETMVLPGDIFSDPENSEHLWINVTPACHTVLNRPEVRGEAPAPDKVRLHLVRGTRQELPSSKSDFNKLKQKHDGPNGFLVHAMVDGAPYHFEFKERRIVTWGQVGSTRIGRLLPPYITLMQQQHASFLMNEGLPAIGPEFYEDRYGSPSSQ